MKALWSQEYYMSLLSSGENFAVKYILRINAAYL